MWVYAEISHFLSIVWVVLAVAVLSGGQTICIEACLNTGKSVFVYQKVIMGTLLIVLIVNMKATLSNDPETRSVKFQHMPTQRKLSSMAFFHGDRQVCVPKVGSPCHHCHV